MKKDETYREIIFTEEFVQFLNQLDNKIKNKYDDAIVLLRGTYVLNTKFVKKIVGVDQLYELRISIGYNEYRSIIFSIDHDNIIQATKLILLNGFLKKGTKDYRKEIKNAINILKRL
ncbi:type II toxin-antitoxin system RelE/ParE family toxin [Elizabethkingia ursingii]|uniref:type II toxin-antitoxin system RelE/ParE family toxin n=1 Tax=Elizabethkingia ursingii TaxID=1756150 RepID=UPI0020132A77|nr:type II toxin-antitoxin system RelE/ParE family toxin [Elizabethkingia ursingii]MCL1663409.1 type II toxin-antitoxin system RelE/ParE family toxin [Elizabethkingia ursingii]